MDEIAEATNPAKQTKANPPHQTNGHGKDHAEASAANGKGDGEDDGDGEGDGEGGDKKPENPAPEVEEEDEDGIHPRDILITGSADGTARSWALATGKQLKVSHAIRVPASGSARRAEGCATIDDS